jgi:hypothetical protein
MPQLVSEQMWQFIQVVDKLNELTIFISEGLLTGRIAGNSDGQQVDLSLFQEPECFFHAAPPIGSTVGDMNDSGFFIISFQFEGCSNQHFTRSGSPMRQNCVELF